MRERTVELQAVRSGLGEDSERDAGLKTGARVALLLPSAYERLLAHREALEARHGPQPDNALVFQMLSADGPLWYEDGFPVEWSDDYYKRWTARVWRPARRVAAQAPDAPDWIAGLTFYELRHSAISTALHSTLAMTADGMNLHALAAYAGHDVQTHAALTTRTSSPATARAPHRPRGGVRERARGRSRSARSRRRAGGGTAAQSAASTARPCSRGRRRGRAVTAARRR